MSTYYPVLNELFMFLNTSITQVSSYASRIPGSSILWKYIKNSHQDDPYRSLLELLLACFVVWYLFAKKYRTDNFIELTPQEVEELIDEWQPEPLVSSLNEKQKWELEKTPVIIGPPGLKPKLANGSTVINLASFDFLGLSNNEKIKEKAIETLRGYGVGACGPPGFYGTLDVHTEFERSVSKFLGAEESILYSQGFSTISSAIPSFCKRGDIIIVQKGVQISRSVVKWFDHNDMNDLERILKEIKAEDIETGRQLTRRFIVTEGIFQNFGDIAPLPEL
ncbi:13044_t:CDS:2, partial [Ambispora leptoticha]